jgi:hypothetical protein
MFCDGISNSEDSIDVSEGLGHMGVPEGGGGDR